MSTTPQELHNRWKVRRQGLLLVLLGLWVLVTPWLTRRAIRRATWDAEPTFDQHGAVATQRGDLHPDDAWRGTPDDRLPGGTYEPTVAAWLEEHGREECAFRWLMRNRAHGARRRYAVRSNADCYGESTWFPETRWGVGWITRGVRSDGTRYFRLRVGPIAYVEGHRVYRYLDGSYWAVPTATIKRA